MKHFSIRTNSILMIFRQVCSVLFSMILSPYVHRTLGPTSLGKITFVSSIINYFSLLASNGIGAYAVREGSKLKDDESRLSKFINTMFSFRFLSTFVSYLILLITFVLWDKLKENSALLVINSLSIFFSAISCEWLYRIYENYRFLSFKSILKNVLVLLLVFAFIKDSNDYIRYSLIMILTDGFLSIISFLIIRKYSDLSISFSDMDLSDHIKPISILFMNYLVSIIYTSSDITLLGIMKDSASVGIYGSAVNIYNTIRDIIVSFIIVSVPQLSHAVGLSDRSKFNTLAEKVYTSLMALVLPSAIGLFLISKNVLLLFTSSEFLGGAASLCILSIALIFSVVGRFSTTCLLIPLHKEKTVLIASACASVLNFLLNLFLIPSFGILATASTTLLSEILIVIISLYSVKHNISFDFFSKDILICIAGCIGIFACCKAIDVLQLSLIADTLAKVAGSAIVYALILYINKHSVFIAALDSFLQLNNSLFKRRTK